MMNKVNIDKVLNNCVTYLRDSDNEKLKNTILAKLYKLFDNKTVISITGQQADKVVTPSIGNYSTVTILKLGPLSDLRISTHGNSKYLDMIVNNGYNITKFYISRPEENSCRIMLTSGRSTFQEVPLISLNKKTSKVDYSRDDIIQYLNEPEDRKAILEEIKELFKKSDRIYMGKDLNFGKVKTISTTDSCLIPGSAFPITISGMNNLLKYII